MTSKWIQSAPASTTLRTSSPRRAKSADRILGAIRVAAWGAVGMMIGVSAGIMCHYCSLPYQNAARSGYNRPRQAPFTSAHRERPVKPYDLTVTVAPVFVPEQSDPAEQQYVFAYTVRITNTGEHP